MFVCEECLKSYKPVFDVGFRSRGPCECCGKVRTCSDIPCTRLELKDKPEGKHCK
jgi:hypothetical protein